MSTRLIQIIQVPLPAGQTLAVPHAININDIPQIPDFACSDNPDVEVVSVTTTLLTVKNLSASPQTGDIWLKLEHSTPREVGMGFASPWDNIPTGPRPFIVANGPGGGGVDANGVIFRPGVPSAGNHVATWAEVATRVTAAEGALDIYVDDSIAPTHAPVASGVTNCKGARIIGYPTIAPPFANLIIDDGAQLLDVREVSQITITGNPSGGTPSLGFSFGGAFISSEFSVRDAALVGGNGTTPFISVAANAELDLLLLEASDTSGSGSNFLQLGNGSFVLLTLVESSILLDGIITGQVASFLFLQFDDTVITPDSYSGFAGFYAPFALSKTTGYPQTTTTSQAAFSFDSFERNENYAVLVFGGGACTVTMPANPQLWEQHEIKNFDGVNLTVNGNGFQIEDPAIPGTYGASFNTSTIANFRLRFFPAGFTSAGTGVWTLV